MYPSSRASLVQAYFFHSTRRGLGWDGAMVFCAAAGSGGTGWGFFIYVCGSISDKWVGYRRRGTGVS